MFNGGKTPYPGVDPLSLAGLLDSGYRMERSKNAACTDKMFARFFFESKVFEEMYYEVSFPQEQHDAWLLG